MTWVRVTVTKTAGSAPRGVGTQMRVFADHIDGTIGGGALEWRAMAHARTMMLSGQNTKSEVIPLGPALGQCCGGAVTLAYDLNAPLDPPKQRQVWVYGAGHVGRELVTILAMLPDREITWVDVHANKFPSDMPVKVNMLVATDPSRVVGHAAADAEHLILTHSHDIDLALCHTILGRSFHSAGLIGSATKWARFRKRLRDLGHHADDIMRIDCPIGDTSLGKRPVEIAIGVVTAMIARAKTADKDQTA